MKKEPKKEEKEEKQKMFFGKLFGKKNTQLPDDCVIPSQRNILLIGRRSPPKKSLFQALCGEKEPEKTPFRVQRQVKFDRKEIVVGSGKTVILNIWSITGKELLWGVLHPYFNGAHGIILYYDPTDKESFDNIKSLIGENNEMISKLNVPIRIVSFTEKKGDKSVIPKKEEDGIEKKIGSKGVKCCFNDAKSVNGVLTSLVDETIKKYNLDLGSGRGNIDLPPKPAKEIKETDREDGHKEDSLAPLFSLIKYDGNDAEAKIVERNENGLFGDCCRNDMFSVLSYNISVLGCPKIGKTMLCKRYLYTKFHEEGKKWTRAFNLPNGKYLKLKATEGELPKDKSDEVANYKRAHAVLLCYDITSRTSFDELKCIIKEVKDNSRPGAVLMVVGLKYDEKERVDVTGSEGKAFADENCAMFRECSAGDDLGVSGIFSKILLELQKIDGFGLPIRVEEANNTLPPSIVPVDGKKDKEGAIKTFDFKRAPTDDYDYLFKILIIGDPGVGKTCLLQRFSDDTWTDSKISTDGLGFKIITLYHPSGYVVKLQIWDPTGQEPFKNDGYYPFYRGSRGIIIFYDTTNTESIDQVKQWLGEADRYACEKASRLIVGTKIDLTDKVVVDPTAVLEVANKYEALFAECSSKTSAGVGEAFEMIVDAILKRVISEQK